MAKKPHSVPREVESQEDLEAHIDEQNELIDTHMHISASGLAALGCAEELIALSMVKIGLNELCVGYAESHRDEMTVEVFINKTKEMLSAVMADLEVGLREQLADIAMAEKHSNGSPSKH